MKTYHPDLAPHDIPGYHEANHCYEWLCRNGEISKGHSALCRDVERILPKLKAFERITEAEISVLLNLEQEFDRIAS
jgi:hypothetical protein